MRACDQVIRAVPGGDEAIADASAAAASGVPEWQIQASPCRCRGPESITAVVRHRCVIDGIHQHDPDTEVLAQVEAVGDRVREQQCAMAFALFVQRHGEARHSNGRYRTHNSK